MWACRFPGPFLYRAFPRPPSPHHENQGPSLLAPAGALGPKPPALCTLADLILALGTTYPAPMGQGHTVSPSAPLRRVGMASSTASPTDPLLSRGSLSGTHPSLSTHTRCHLRDRTLSSGDSFLGPSFLIHKLNDWTRWFSATVGGTTQQQTRGGQGEVEGSRVLAPQ